MRLDSHQHFWSYNRADYVWMTDEMELLRRDYLPQTLQPRLARIGFDGTIAVQARQMLAETDWLLDLSDRYAFIRGVVGWVDFQSDTLEKELEHYARYPKFKGVRELIHDMADINYATSDVHVSAVSKLGRLGLTYDLLLKPPHMRPASRLVQRFPNQPFVIDHIAKPQIATGGWSHWEADIRALAKFDNVYCKLSGMVTEAEWCKWEPSNFHPYLDVVLNAFGADRLMIGSDWPVCILSGSYEDVMGIVIDYTETLSAQERERILGVTCAQFYDVVQDDVSVPSRCG
jgi:L-fuconolactonase